MMPAVVVLEAVRQRYRWQTNWVLYRFTAEALKQERHLFPSGVGPSASADRLRVLAEQIEGLSPRSTPSGPGARAGPSRSCRAGPAAPRRVRRGDRWGQAAVRGAAAVMVARAAAKFARR